MFCWTPRPAPGRFPSATCQMHHARWIISNFRLEYGKELDYFQLMRGAESPLAPEPRGFPYVRDRCRSAPPSQKTPLIRTPPTEYPRRNHCPRLSRPFGAAHWPLCLHRRGAPSPRHFRQMEPLAMRRPLHHSARDGRRPSPVPEPDFGRIWPVGFSIFCSAALIVLVILAVWLVIRFDWTPVLDFIAPTAMQARETGWTAIAEGL